MLLSQGAAEGAVAHPIGIGRRQGKARGRAGITAAVAAGPVLLGRTGVEECPAVPPAHGQQVWED